MPRWGLLVLVNSRVWPGHKHCQVSVPTELGIATFKTTWQRNQGYKLATRDEPDPPSRTRSEDDQRPSFVSRQVPTPNILQPGFSILYWELEGWLTAQVHNQIIRSRLTTTPSCFDNTRLGDDSLGGPNRCFKIQILPDCSDAEAASFLVGPANGLACDAVKKRCGSGTDATNKGLDSGFIALRFPCQAHRLASSFCVSGVSLDRHSPLLHQKVRDLQAEA